MTNGPSLLSEVRFAALLVYSPRGGSEASVKSRKVRDGVKNDTPPMILRAVERLVSVVECAGLEEFLGEDATLVPVPRRAPLRKDALWPGKRIAETLLEHGLGAEVLPCLSRFYAVRKSAYSGPGERPGPKTHFDSFEVVGSLLSPEKVTLVDDFVTKGATLLGAASRVKEAFPRAEVRAFALIRTMGLIPDVERIVEPCVGRIWVESSDVHREP